MHWASLAILVVICVAFGVYAVVMVVHGYFMLRNRVPYVVLPAGALPEVARELEVRHTDTVVDLGCGDGRVLAALQEACPQAKYTGVENDWMVWLMARWRTRGMKIVRGEIADSRLEGATRVFCYLGPQMMAELEPRFEAELPPGARVVSVQFPLPNRQADKVVELAGSASHAASLYVYNY